MLTFVLKELDVKGYSGSSNVFDLSVEMISCGLVDVKSLITHRMPFDESKEAFELAADPSSGAMKIMINLAKGGGRLHMSVPVVMSSHCGEAFWST